MKKNFLAIFLLFSFSLAAQPSKVDSLSNLLPALSNDTSRVNILIALALELKSNAPQKSIDYSKEAHAIATEGQYKSGIGRSNIAWGMALINLGLHKDAKDKLTEGLKISQSQGDKKSAAMAFNNLGIIDLQQGNYSEALKNYSQALQLYREIGNKNGIAVCYGNMGVVYDYLGNYSEAIKNHYEALKILEEVGDKASVASTYNNIAVIYYAQNNLQDALQNNLEALKIRKEIGDKQGLATSYVNIGAIYYSQKNYSEALKNFESNLELTREHGNKHGMALAYSNIGTIRSDQGDLNAAYENHFKSVSLQEEIGDTANLVYSYASLGHTLLLQRHIAEAEKYLNKSLLLSRETGSKDALKDAYNELAMLEETRGNYKGALNHYRNYSALKDSLFNEENTSQIAHMKTQYETEKKDNEIALLNKDKTIQEATIQKQKVITYAIIAGVILISLLSYFLIRSYNQRKKLIYEKQITDAEMKALRSQVSPHFLFNSLNSLIALIREDEERSVEFAEQLSRIYRYVLQSSGRRLTTLGEEIDFIRAYFFLLKTRFGDNLKEEITVSEMQMDKRLPPLTLQLLAENAVKHNKVTDVDPLYINIFTNDHGRLVIKNNLQKKLQLVPSNKIGLSNIRKSYELLGYPGMNVEETPTAFIVTLPLI